MGNLRDWHEKLEPMSHFLFPKPNTWLSIHLSHLYQSMIMIHESHEYPIFLMITNFNYIFLV